MRTSFKTISAVAGISAAALCHAQDIGWYVGGSLGQTKFKEWCTGSAPGVIITSCEDSDTGMKALGGYQFNRHFALEGTIIYWGEASATASTSNVRRATIENSSVGGAAVGILPLGERSELFGKLGFVRTSQELTRSLATGGSVAIDGDDTETHYGIGVKFKLTPQLRLRAEWERTDKLEVEMLSIGVEYRFY